ncbi:MAG: IclR family transcriptional regulator [Xanthobacteraceae bacterium]
MPESDVSAVKDDLYASPPVQRAARLLRRIAEGDAVTNMSRTARELGINRTTLLRLLHALESERFIEPRSEGEGWRIGVGLITLTAQAFFSEDLVQTAVPVLTRLAAATTLSAHLAVLDGHEIVYLVRRVPNHAFASNIRIGSRLPAHATNMGRSILANLPRDRVDRLYSDFDLRPVTPHTPVTPLQLRTQLDADRALGLAWSDGNYEAGISSVASAIFDVSNTPVAAINVTGQTAQFEGAERRAQISGAVREAAREISMRLGWHDALQANGSAQPDGRPADAAGSNAREQSWTLA